MTCVIIEQTPAEPVAPSGVEEDDRRSAWCFERHRVRCRGHYVAADGLRLACHFEAPDAEAVRRSLRDSDYEGDPRIWSATVHGPDAPSSLCLAAPGLEIVLVERDFEAPVDFGQVQALEDRGGWCLDANGVRFRRSYFAYDRRRMLCLYEAPDTEAVRRVQTRLGLPFTRAWATRPIAGLPA
jgi:hypothetical protein